jgi:hypothetical protein
MTWYPLPRGTTREYLHLDDKTKLGANAIDYSSSLDQSAKLQFALNYAAATTGNDGEVLLAGIITSTQQITMPNTRPVAIRGLGADPSRSCINFTTDLGPGVFGLRTTKSQIYDLADFAMVGPGSTPGYGVLPSEMYGFYTEGRGIAVNLQVKGFGAGVALTNDHQEFHSVDLRGNGYAVDFLENPAGGLGDQYWERCYFTDQTRAGWAVNETNTVANCRAIQGHIGASPYGIWRYPSGLISGTGANGGTTLTNVAIPPWFPVSAMDGLVIGGANVTPGTTVLSHSGSGFNYTLNLSAPLTGQVTAFYFTLVTYAATGSNGNNVLTGVNIPSHVDLSSFSGVKIGGPNIPANTTMTNVTGTPGNYTVTMSASATGPVPGVYFPARGTALAGVIFENHSFEYCGVSAMYDEGRARGTWKNITFDSPGEFGTGGGVKWPGKPTTQGNYVVGDVQGWHWRDNDPSAQADVPAQPYLLCDAILDVVIDGPTTIASGIALNDHKSFQIRNTSVGVRALNIGKRGAKGNQSMHFSGAVASTTITRGDLLEITGTGNNQVRPATGTGQSCIVGFAIADYVANDVCIFATQAESFWIIVRNRTGSPIANGSLLKPDPTNNGGVIAATNLSDSPIVGRVTEPGSIAAGGTGTAQVFIS